MDQGGSRPDARTLLGECAVPAAIGTVLAALAAAMLARRQALFGNFGDPEQLVWQTKNLLNILTSGDALIRDSFFGSSAPYAYMPTSFGEAGFIAVVRWLADVWFAYNFALFLGFVANYIAMYWCLRRAGTSPRAAGVGAWVFLLAAQTMAQAIAGHLWFTWTFLIPPLLLLVARAGRSADPRWWISTAIVAGLFAWIHEYLWVFATAVSSAAVIVTLVRQRPLPWRSIAAGATLTMVLLAPLAWAQWQRLEFDRSHPAVRGRTAAVAARFSSTPSHFVRASDSSLLYLDVPEPFTRGFEWETLNYLGLTSLAASLAALLPAVRRRMDPRLKSLLLRTSPVAMAGFLWSLGPNIGGGDPASNPIAALYDSGTFLLSDLTAWGRFGVFVAAWFALVVAAVADALFRSMPRVGTIVVVVLMSIAVPIDQYPYFDSVVHEASAPPVMIAAISSSPADTRVAHVPLDPGGNARYNAMAQFLQTFHGRPIVNGYMSFIRPRYFEGLTADPIGCLQTNQVVSGRCPPVADIARSIERSDIGWVVLDRFQTELTVFSAENPFRVALRMEAIAKTLDRLVDRGTLAREFVDEDYELYRVLR